MIASEEHELLVEAAKDPVVVRTLLKMSQADGEVTDVAWPDGAHPPPEPALEPEPEEEDSTEDTALSRVRTFRPDAVKVFSTQGRNTLAVAVEAQRSKNYKKRWSWVYYPGRLFLDHHCDALTLVITVSEERYRWATRQRDKIPDRFRWQVVVVGPKHIQSTLTDEEAAESLGLAILAASKRASVAPDSPAAPLLRTLALATQHHLDNKDLNALALWYRILDKLFTPEEVQRFMKTDTKWIPTGGLKGVIDAETIELQTQLLRARAERDRKDAEHEQELARKDAERDRAVVQTFAEARGWTLTPAQKEALATEDLEQLQAMRARASTAKSPEQVFLLD